MDNKKFSDFVIAARKDERVIYDPEVYGPYIDVIKEIYADFGYMKYYTSVGKFQDILIKLLKSFDYDKLGYGTFLKDIEKELEKLVVNCIILLPINFIKSENVGTDLELNEYMNLFLHTANDLKDFSDSKLLIKQEKRRKDKKHKLDDNLSKYFENVINSKLDKEHILLAKDREFFNYPILTLCIRNTSYNVEAKSGKIVEAVYSILRMIDFIKEKDIYGWGLLDRGWKRPAHTYTVYYNEPNQNKKSNQNNQYYGYSFRFNFSYFLDINQDCFTIHKYWFTRAIDLFIKACFIDEKKYTLNDAKKINRWKNAILMFNTAFEFASTEKYDACALILCSILESLFLKNEGRNKLNKLLEQIDLFFEDIYTTEQVDNLNETISSVYKFRNKIMHEGVGYESVYLTSRRLNSYQGVYTGMRPFDYIGATVPTNEIYDIKSLMKCIIDILIGDKTLSLLNSLLKDEITFKKQG